MYQYDEYDQALVSERVAQFRDQIARRLDGELSEEEFLPLRLQNGLYLQKHAYMLRVAIPYGTLSSPQLRALAHVARHYDRGYGHFTTRQNIQFNWIELEQVGDILEHLAGAQMHAIQTSGNCVRNITTEAFAGVAADEWTDPRPLAEILRQWSTVNPEFLFLPRKFKIALSSAVEDPSRRSCGSTTATAGATTSTRRGSRSWSRRWASRLSPARWRKSGSTCATARHN